MDKASDYESGDSRFESWQGRVIFFLVLLLLHFLGGWFLSPRPGSDLAGSLITTFLFFVEFSIAFDSMGWIPLYNSGIQLCHPARDSTRHF